VVYVNRIIADKMILLDDDDDDDGDDDDDDDDDDGMVEVRTTSDKEKPCKIKHMLCYMCINIHNSYKGN